MKKGKKAKKQQIVKERDCEDWCFVCKDGGDLMLCDYDDCLKVYHPECVEKDDSFVETGQHWICGRHSCLICHKAPKLYCYCCPNAVCGHCISAAEFLPIKGKQGLCNDCLELVVIVDEQGGLDSGGDKIDLTDRDTHECLFLEYWDIIKEEEGLTLDDIYLAEARLKKGQYSKYNLKSNRIGKGKKNPELIIIDSDPENTEEYKAFGKRKGSKAFEYVGWGSKPLIEFLKSIGKDTSKELSQYDVDSIICKYVEENKLFDPTKKKKIFCDERLYSIFRRKSLHKNKIYNLLEDHLAVEISEDDGDRDEIESFFGGKKKTTMLTQKRSRTLSLDKESQEMEAFPEVQESCFASIVIENIKLVYLWKSLMEELVNEPDSFEDKVVGSFVKVKNDPKDCMQRNSHQLLQVTGVKQTSTIGGNKSEVFLRVSSFPTDVGISMLSDFDICEEEIGDLKLKVEKGLHPRSTVMELEQKAKNLHDVITKHWIEKELVRLQKHIDFANEKGWRRELHYYLDQQQLLKNPSEQERLLRQLPKVIPEIVECKTGSIDSKVDAGKSDESPQSIPSDTSKLHCGGMV